jgi:hypothetical protein
MNFKSANSISEYYCGPCTYLYISSIKRLSS